MVGVHSEIAQYGAWSSDGRVGAPRCLLVTGGLHQARASPRSRTRCARRAPRPAPRPVPVPAPPAPSDSPHSCGSGRTHSRIRPLRRATLRRRNSEFASGLSQMTCIPWRRKHMLIGTWESFRSDHRRRFDPVFARALRQCHRPIVRVYPIRAQSQLLTHRPVVRRCARERACNQTVVSVHVRGDPMRRTDHRARPAAHHASRTGSRVAVIDASLREWSSDRKGRLAFLSQHCTNTSSWRVDRGQIGLGHESVESCEVVVEEGLQGDRARCRSWRCTPRQAPGPWAVGRASALSTMLMTEARAAFRRTR